MQPEVPKVHLGIARLMAPEPNSLLTVQRGMQKKMKKMAGLEVPVPLLWLSYPRSVRQGAQVKPWPWELDTNWKTCLAFLLICFSSGWKIDGAIFQSVLVCKL
jgi:hypothetical protein